eukprot:gene8566-6007_t
MFRASLLRRLSVVATVVPPNFSSSADVAFYFPRFQPATHLSAAGIPELQEALGLLASETLHVRGKEEGPSKRPSPPLAVKRWVSSADKTKCLDLLDRGAAILESAGGLQSPAVRSLLRPIYATRFEMLFGTAHLPRPTHTPPGAGGVVHGSGRGPAAYRGGALHIPKHVLYHSSRLLLSPEGWSLGEGGSLEPAAIDTDCVVLAHFVKAFCLLHTRPFHQLPPAPASAAAARVSSIKKSRGPKDNPYATPSSSWALDVGGPAPMTLAIALERLDQLRARVAAAAQQAGEDGGFPVVSWRFHEPKLLLLKAMLTIPSTGHLLHAKQLVDEAARSVHQLKRRKHILLDGLKDGERPAEPELGLFLLAQAEIMARVWDWGGGKPGTLKKVACGTGETHVVAGELDEDVMDAFENAAGFYAAPFSSTIKADGIMDLSLLPERQFEVHAYVVCVLSLASVLMNAPRAAKGGAGPSDIIFADSARLRPITVEEARKTVGHLLERALQLTRGLYPEQRDHPLAAHILTVMACLYADTRDYLYASGLFESARRGVAAQYGGLLSPEGVFVEKLRYEFLAGVGSAEEAKTAGHEIVQHLKQMDALPVQ